MVISLNFFEPACSPTKLIIDPGRGFAFGGRGRETEVMAPENISAPISHIYFPLARFIRRTPLLTLPAHATSDLNNVFDRFLSGIHLVVEVQHIFLRH